nr:M48 family metalloprotease [Pseudomonas sp.]
ARWRCHWPGAPSLNVFGVRDASINAFAMPGGHIGIHSGLVVSAQSESELAGVLAHEIAHVSQRHVARQLGQQNQSGMLMMGMMAAALAAALAGAGDLAHGAAVFGQAAVLNSQLAFSREAEREADRIGLQMIQAAGYDPTGTIDMFSRLMQTSRFNQGTGPSYASTHPMSIERMSDMQNRTRGQAAVARNDSPTFWFVRAKLSMLQSGYSRAVDPIALLRSEAASQGGARAAAAHYGVAIGLLGQGNPAGARAAWQDAMATGVSHPMLAELGAELSILDGRFDDAARQAADAFKRWPQQRALALVLARSLQRAGRDEEALDFLQARIEQWPTQEPVLYRMAAESCARLGRPVPEKRNMAEYYVLTGALPAALSQLQQARSVSKDFHEKSVLDARITDVQRRVAEDKALMAQFRG